MEGAMNKLICAAQPVLDKKPWWVYYADGETRKRDI
jgi:hypothetical protein